MTAPVRIERGDPSPDEVAALIVALSVVAGSRPSPGGDPARARVPRARRPVHVPPTSWGSGARRWSGHS